MLMGLGMALSLQPGSAQDSASTGKMARPGVKEFQVPFDSLRPEAAFRIGEDADWVQITDDAVWVASSNPASVHRIDPNTNKEVAIVPVPGDPCAGLAFVGAVVRQAKLDGASRCHYEQDRGHTCHRTGGTRRRHCR
jgi:sugar lactone lactonase YvrE